MAVLAGTPTVKVTLDQGSIDAATRSFGRALRAEAPRLVKTLAAGAARIMRGLEEGVGHPFLAGLWTIGDVHVEPDMVWCEVYSEAEDMDFANKGSISGEPTGAEPSFKGERLIRWLEYGVGDHPIDPQPGKVLSFKGVPAIPGGGGDAPGAPGESESNFLGSMLTARGVEHARFLNPAEQEEVIALHVDHPGFAGNRHLVATRESVERALTAAAQDSANRVAGSV